MAKLTTNDVATVPPVDRNGEMATAATLLKRFRKQLMEGELTDPAWQKWVAESLLAGLGEPSDAS